MLKVLVVENNPTITRLLTHHLETEDCLVQSAEDGLEALILLDSYTPDIIITDIIMPKISGDQLCQIIRQDRKLDKVYLVVHSSITIEDRKHVLELDADIYIAKGAASKYQDHVEYILKQYRSDARKQRKIIGSEGLHQREITTELLLARRHNQIVFENITDAVIELDSSGKIVQVNRAAQHLLQKDIKTLLSSRLLDYLGGPDFERVANWLEMIPEEEESFYESDYDVPLMIKDEEIMLSMVSLKDEEQVFVVAIIQNITAQKRVENRLEKTLLDLDAVIESIDYGVLFMDKNLRARLVNRAFREMWGVSEEQVAQKLDMRDLMNLNRYNNIYDVPEDEFDAYVDAREAQVKAGPIEPVEFARKDGKVFQYQCVVLPDDGRMLTYYDITTLKKAKDELAEMLEKVSKLANHDPLTKLANLRLAKERINLSLALAERQRWQVAVLFIDLDGFKEINDSYGHEKGDLVLQQVAERLQENRRSVDTIARIGGDEFIILQTEVKHREDVENVAANVVEKLSQPFNLGDGAASISASVGIALFPEHGKDGRELLSKADNAMYKVKKEGKNNFGFCDNN